MKSEDLTDLVLASKKAFEILRVVKDSVGKQSAIRIVERIVAESDRAVRESIAAQHPSDAPDSQTIDRQSALVCQQVLTELRAIDSSVDELFREVDPFGFVRPRED